MGFWRKGVCTQGGLTEEGADEVVVGSCDPGAAEGLSGLEEELILPALRAGGGIQGPGHPGEGRRMGRLGAPPPRAGWAWPSLPKPQASFCPLYWADHVFPGFMSTPNLRM